MSEATVVTFYSYKGGVGRSLALANIAVELANRGRDVVVVDMDLESPGVPWFFRISEEMRPICARDIAEEPGMLDLLVEYRNTPSEPPDVVGSLIEVHHPQAAQGTLKILTAGRADTFNQEHFSWSQFYENHGYGCMEHFRDALVHSGADYVLIDSRTGLTDVGSVCTAQLPNILVMLFALHNQGIEGTRAVAAGVQRRKKMDGVHSRLHSIFLVPSRIERSLPQDRLGSFLDTARRTLGEAGELLDELEDQFPYEPHIACGEPIVVGPGVEPVFLSRAYTRLADRLEEVRDGSRLDKGESRPGDIVSAIRNRAPDPQRTQLASAQKRLWDAIRNIKERTVFSDWSDLLADEIVRAAMQLRLHHQSALAAYEKLRALLRPLAGGQTLESPPATPSEWDALEESLRTQCDAVVQGWQSAARSQMDALMRDRSDGVLQAVRSESDQLKDHIEQLEYQEFSAGLTSMEARLQRLSLGARLHAGVLERVELVAEFFEERKRLAWMHEQLSRLLEDQGLSDRETEQALACLLGLWLEEEEESAEPGQILWDAYELWSLHLATSERASTQFESVGHHLWARTWRWLHKEEYDFPVIGEVSEAQLQESAERRSSHFVRLTQVATASLEQLDQWRQRRLLEKRLGDPLIAASVRQMVDERRGDYVHAGAAWWSYNRTSAVNDAMIAALTTGWTYGLAEQGDPASALYVWARFAKQRPELWTMTPPQHLADVLTGWLVRRICVGQLQEVVENLLDLDLHRRVQKSIAGRALVALLASDLLETQERGAAASLCLNLATGEFSEYLPEALHSHIERLAETSQFQDRPFERSLHEAVHRVKERASVSFYRSWEPARYYERAFLDYWNEQLNAVLEESSEQAALSRIAEIQQLDARSWFEQTARKFSQDRPNLSALPEGRTLTQMIAAFNAAQDASKALEAFVRAAPLRVVLARRTQRQEAACALQKWLDTDDTSAEWARRAVKNLLPEHT